MYLLDKEGWCRIFNLSSSTLAEATHYPMQAQECITSPISQENSYPALTRVTCHGGESRWQVSSSSSSCHAYMEEVRVSHENVISSHWHPPPPSPYGTALCSGFLDRHVIDNLRQGCFEFYHSTNTWNYISLIIFIMEMPYSIKQMEYNPVIWFAKNNS